MLIKHHKNDCRMRYIQSSVGNLWCIHWEQCSQGKVKFIASDAGWRKHENVVASLVQNYMMELITPVCLEYFRSL